MPLPRRPLLSVVADPEEEKAGEAIQVVGGTEDAAMREECRRRIDSAVHTTAIPDEIAGDPLTSLAYLFLKFPDNECWATLADGTTNEGHRFARTTEEHIDYSTFAAGSMKVVLPYPDAHGRHVIVHCKSGTENYVACADDFHFESSKQILLRHILTTFLATIPREDHVRFAKIAKIETVGFHKGQRLSAFRIEERLDTTAMAHLKSIPNQIERQRVFCSILLQIRNTLDVLQHFRFAHGDLKLDNIGVKLLPNGCVQAYFLDFGLSCFQWADISVGSKTSVFYSRRNDPPIFLLQNDLLFLLISSITKIRGLFYLGCADSSDCMLEKMILFVLTAAAQGGNIEQPYMVYEPRVFGSGRHAELLSNTNVEAIVCALILHYKTQVCNIVSPSTEARLQACKSKLMDIYEEITRLSSPIEFIDGGVSSPPMMTGQRPERT